MPIKKSAPTTGSKNGLVDAVVALNGGNTKPWAPKESEAADESPGWWADTDWFQGLTVPEIDVRLGSLPAEQDWVVLPVAYVDELRTVVETLAARLEHGGTVGGSGTTDGLARELMMTMVQRIGFSTTHAQNAWEMARAFEAEKVKQAAARNGGVK